MGPRLPLLETNWLGHPAWVAFWPSTISQNDCGEYNRQVWTCLFSDAIITSTFHFHGLIEVDGPLKGPHCCICFAPSPPGAEGAVDCSEQGQ